MTRSQINENFIDKTFFFFFFWCIDKTFTIVANILFRIIPTTFEEKEAFTYYKDGAI
ncbi:transmembrane protein, putative [Medicago truncatula]|uniref:Transmembrane protein, putative n=1 Tax=Medicago truncatula TaxID=3880 RepID=G7I3P0_MEDTR|nr:transmembrane protein, putative [Medicago truncatula]